MSTPVYKHYSEVVQQILDGEVGVIPTDTLYGLVAIASNQQAVSKLYSLKLRTLKPGTVIADSVQQLVDLGLKKRYLSAVEDYWPGAISIVLPTGVSLGYLHLGEQSLAVRISEDIQLSKLLIKTGPLITTSANLPRKKPAATVQQAIDYFGDKVDFYVDGGDLSDRKPSTIIRVVDDAIEVLREGSVNVDEETGRTVK